MTCSQSLKANMTAAPYHSDAPTRPTRPSRRFQPARATLLLILSTGMLGYSATQVLTTPAQPEGFLLSTTHLPSPPRRSRLCSRQEPNYDPDYPARLV
ncbi:hypothetical protein GCM10008957_56530 [Deinococcus ruber]|uniref:Uncharacterized protein n=1 Tax=Deinococcus ruber TaxID=1848197 RepID=A0A918FJ28_9DEIO|nr:hypothetical protein GCM10008957_56530 [Deinococcus ruber]